MRSTSVRAAITLGILGAIGACSDNAPAPGGTNTGGSPELLAAPMPGQGVQLKMVSELAPGVETERCQFYKVPREGLYVNRQQIRYTPGSHHVLVYLTPYEEIPTRNLHGEEVDTSGVFECGKGGPTYNWSVDQPVGGAQKADAPPSFDGLPSDTALVLPGGSVLMMNTHYLNASAKPLLTDARVNFYTIPREQVKREAGLLFFYNPFIHIPAGGRAAARMACPIRKDITLVTAESHMHRRGVDYVAYLTDAEGNRLDELYRTKEWEEVVLRRFEPAPGKELKAGQWIDYQCGYDNPEDRTVIQGLSTRDEMCMFLGAYYPREAQTEFCALDEEGKARFLGARFIGTGTTDGASTADCLTQAMSAADGGDEPLFRCVVSSCPKVSQEMSDSTRCLFESGQRCESSCQLGPDACGSCLRNMCESPLEKLRAAPCN
jgi:hypothetical protein